MTSCDKSSRSMPMHSTSGCRRPGRRRAPSTELNLNTFTVMSVVSLPHVNNIFVSLSPSLPSPFSSFLLAASSLVLGITVLIRTYLLDGLISLYSFVCFEYLI